MMSGTLNIAGLNGLAIVADQANYAGSVTQSGSTYTVAGSSLFPLQDFNSKFTSAANVKINLMKSVGSKASSFSLATARFELGDSKFSGGGLSNLKGWNADSILIVARASEGAFEYLIISDKPVSSLTSSELVFSETGPGPTIDGVSAITCFTAGTRISTAIGLTAVEDLQLGDLVRTISGKLQPIVWIGTKTLTKRGERQPAKMLPILIEAGAFGAGKPLRDLCLSPEHTIYIADHLVPAHALVNGATIRQIARDETTYYHVELRTHDVIFAEGLPAESYLETGSRPALRCHERGARAA